MCCGCERVVSIVGWGCHTQSSWAVVALIRCWFVRSRACKDERKVNTTVLTVVVMGLNQFWVLLWLTKDCVILWWSSKSSKKLKFRREFIVYNTNEENGREERKEINRGGRAHSIYLCYILSEMDCACCHSRHLMIISVFFNSCIQIDNIARFLVMFLHSPLMFKSANIILYVCILTNTCWIFVRCAASTPNSIPQHPSSSWLETVTQVPYAGVHSLLDMTNLLSLPWSPSVFKHFSFQRFLHLRNPQKPLQSPIGNRLLVM